MWWHKQPPFSWAHEFFGAVFQRGHSRDGLSLFHHVPQVWRLEWSGESKSRVWNYLEVSSLTCSVPGLKWFKGWVSLGWLTKKQKQKKNVHMVCPSLWLGLLLAWWPGSHPKRKSSESKHYKRHRESCMAFHDQGEVRSHIRNILPPSSVGQGSPKPVQVPGEGTQTPMTE